MNVLSVFAGIGGIDLGLDRTRAALLGVTDPVALGLQTAPAAPAAEPDLFTALDADAP